MTIEELGGEYNAQWSAIMEKIKRMQEEAKTLCPEKRLKLMRRISSLADSALICKKAAKKLMNYYKEGEE